jgi:hypothetical protein
MNKKYSLHDQVLLIHFDHHESKDLREILVFYIFEKYIFVYTILNQILVDNANYVWF